MCGEPDEACWEHTVYKIRPVFEGARTARGFDTDLRIDDIGDRPNAFLLAYEMNGEPLTGDHGFPIRMASEGKYGYKWCKWLTEVEAVDVDYKGHYEGKRRWSDAGTRGQPVT